MESSINKLADCLTQGFAAMQDSLQQINSRMEHQDRNFCDFLNGRTDSATDNYEPDLEDSNECPADNIFAEISSTNGDGDEVGPEVNGDLADLLNKMMIDKMSESVAKAKEATYLHPKNVHCTKPPKTNKPVWEAMSGQARIADTKLQEVEKDLLRSSLPIAKVMGKLFDCQDNPASIDTSELIWILSDSFKFLGSANINLIKQRKELIKGELPKNMQGLCRDPEVFSTSYLFGDNLNAK